MQCGSSSTPAMTIIRSHCAAATYPKSWQTLPFLGKGANTNEAQGKRIRCLFNIPAEKVELFNQN